ncbi:unnamed protein product [Brassica rapa]|uniref:Uncharacterized protein n=1 Tax=Brassica campestris TaxID=3711 RepID=A0A8D9FZJ8_BRACM|nr:unnamed protein product [Brassica rapa]
MIILISRFLLLRKSRKCIGEDPPVYELPSFSTKQKYSRDETKRQRTQEIALDASLSTWLTTSPTSGCSSISMGAETAMSDSQRSRNTHQTTQKRFKATMKDLYREC